AEALKISPIIEVTTDRRAALKDADYVVCMIQVAGYKPGTVIDFEIPKKYGLRQTIADTLGIGGIMRGLRTIPVLLDITRDMEELCPNALFINYVNPMCMNQWAFSRGTCIKTVGLCHSVPHTAYQLSKDIGVPISDINYLVAGINHMAFYLKFEHKVTGEDLYPLIHKVYDERRVPDWNRVRYDMFKRLGYFVTESSEHFSEYVPWFIKRDRPDMIEKFNIPLDEYIHRCEAQIAGWEELRDYLERPDSTLEIERSLEFGSLIIHSMETATPRIIYGNVANEGIITNLPQGCSVEVPCLVDGNGIQPTVIGAIPPHLAALMQTNINVQALTVEAALTGKREHIYHAAMLDPHTAAELTLDQIWSLVDDLIKAHGDWLPKFN
ncbi:MAG: alpha-glucosidase/alpha-galactosidase, partial [Anaerolineae bacterium]